jgi:hypothetical protein
MAKTARLAALVLALFVWSTASSGAQGQFQTRFESPPEPCDYFSCHQVDPIAVATGSSPEVTFSSLEDGVMFDGDGDGILELMSWPVSGGGWLALDRDGDGRITSGRELLGNHTLPDTANGFDAIARLLPRPKGYITADDPLFHQLVVWTDANRDGIGEGSELEPLSKYVTEILLSYERVDKKDQHGNRYRWQGKAKYVGKQGWLPIYDVVVLTSQP